MGVYIDYENKYIVFKTNSQPLRSQEALIISKTW